MSVPTEITEEIQELFDDSAEKIVGAGYTPVAVLGVYDNVLCLYNHENDNGYTAYTRLSNGAIAEIQLKEAE